MDESLSIKDPILLVGIGGAGSRVAVQTGSVLGCDCLLISDDKRDFVNDEKCASIFVDTEKWVNPSIYKLRHFAQLLSDDIKSALEGFQTVIVISNLAGRAGNAIAPIVCKLAGDNQAVVSVAVMPFSYEKDRIFHSGVSLKRIRDSSDATIVMDNDAFLENNPELSMQECYRISNLSISEALSSIVTTSTVINSEVSLLCTSKGDSSMESSLRDSIAMLYGNISGQNSVKRAMLYVMGGNNVSIGSVNELSKNIRSIFKDEKVSEVAVSLSSSTVAGNDNRVHLLATVQSGIRFDRYDPLADIIPKENVLDWDEMDSSPDIVLSNVQSIE